MEKAAVQTVIQNNDAGRAQRSKDRAIEHLTRAWRDSVSWDRRELSPQILFTKL